MRPPEAAEVVFVADGATWARGPDGLRCLAPYALQVAREVSDLQGRTLEGCVTCEDGTSLPFSLPAAALGDVRALRKALAGLLGSRYRTPQGRLEVLVDAWLAASAVEEVASSPDFGFRADGSAFVDATGTLPVGPGRFAPPPRSAAARLGLAEGDAIGVARALLEFWPGVLGCPATTAALLGMAGWALVAPVLEARDPGVTPLLAWLHGPSEAEPALHAGVVQCLFGRFAETCAALSAASTPLSVALEGAWFRGAVLVVSDATHGHPARGGSGLALLVRRARDRAERRRLGATGTAQPALRSRATWLFVAEDVPASARATLGRLLELALPVEGRRPATGGRLEALLPTLSAMTRALVCHLLATQPWDGLLARYRELVACLSTASDRAASVAAVVVGLEVWASWLSTVGLRLPAESGAVLDLLVGSTAQAAARPNPGEHVLALLRPLLASGAIRLGEPDARGVVLGAWKPDRRVAYLVPEAVLDRLRAEYPEAAATLPPAPLIAADLQRLGALAEHDPERRTRKARVGGKAVNTWSIRAEWLVG